MRTSVVLALVLCLAIMPVAVAHGEDGQKDVFDDWYAMIEMQGGTTWDFKTQCARAYLAGPVLGYRAIRAVVGTEIDVDEETEAKGPVTALAGVTYRLGSLKSFGVDIPWMEHFGFNVGVCGTYEFETGDVGWRGMLSIIDLSFDKGNVERHSNR